MRTFGCSIVVILFFVGHLSAQNSPDCRSAIPVCADAPITGTADGGGIDDFDPDVIRQTGCLEKGSNVSANIEHNTSWYVFRAGTDGQIGFDIEALPVAGGPDIITAEWDFAVYGPDVDCLAVGAGNVEPIRCNFETNSTRYTGIGVNPENGQVGAPFVKQSLNTYDEWLDVKAGEVYYILINNWNTNFDDEAESFTLTFTGRSVQADPGNALDCTLRDEFLGLDIEVCEGAPDIVLSATNSPVGPNFASVVWRVDYGDDGIDIIPLAGGPVLTVQSPPTVYGPETRRYFVQILDSSGAVLEEDDILITYFGNPSWDFDDIIVRDDLSDNNIVEIVMGHPDRNYEYAINGGDFQESPIFNNVPPGENTLIINDRNGCGVSDPIPFLVVGYPKFFTPNGDGIHDYWQVYGLPTLVGNQAIYIFDRYGKLLAQFDGTSRGWDGTYNGKPMPSSDYWFRMDYSRDEGGAIMARSLRRHFTLKR